MGEVDGLSDPQTLTALIKIAVPDYSMPDASMMTTFKGNTSRYKSCQNNGGTYIVAAAPCWREIDELICQ